MEWNNCYQQKLGHQSLLSGEIKDAGKKWSESNYDLLVSDNSEQRFWTAPEHELQSDTLHLQMALNYPILAQR